MKRVFLVWVLERWRCGGGERERGIWVFSFFFWILGWNESLVPRMFMLTITLHLLHRFPAPSELYVFDFANLQQIRPVFQKLKHSVSRPL